MQVTKKYFKGKCLKSETRSSLFLINQTLCIVMCLFASIFASHVGIRPMQIGLVIHLHFLLNIFAIIMYHQPTFCIISLFAVLLSFCITVSLPFPFHFSDIVSLSLLVFPQNTLGQFSSCPTCKLKPSGERM